MDTVFFENVIIKFLFCDAEIRDKIFPFLSPKVFDDRLNIDIIKKYIKYYHKFSTYPTISEMKLEIENKDSFDHLVLIKDLDITEYKQDFLLSEIEDFFKKKLILSVITDTAENLTKDELDKVANSPDILREALAFSFDTKIGLDILNEPERIYDDLHNKDKVISTGISVLDRFTKGGFHEKSLNLFMAETNLGKSLIMCSLATNSLLQNKNVLYITLEMSELKVSERIMANLFDIDINEISEIAKQPFMELFSNWKKKIDNKFVVKEFSARSINTNHIRNLLKELKIKKKFVPDIIYVDYLTIMLACMSNKNDNSYIEIKRISEELRGLATELAIPFISAVQTNRGGFGNVEIDLTDIADSIGTTATADLIIGVTQPDEFRTLNKFCWMILKNRYGLNKKKMSVLVDYFKMRISDDPDDLNSKDMPISPEKQKESQVNKAIETTNDLLNKDNKDKFKKIIDFE
jgi:archaellum biogenesis ATPase FlaH